MLTDEEIRMRCFECATTLIAAERPSGKPSYEFRTSRVAMRMFDTVKFGWNEEGEDAESPGN